MTGNLTLLTDDMLDACVQRALRAVLAEFQLQPVTPAPDEVGGIEFACEITGLARPTLYKLTANRQIPHSKRNKHLFFSRRALEAWLMENRRPTLTELAAERKGGLG